nr:TetR/AcrR family transcriptional regulator [Pseudomonas kuykendallii]
MSVRYSEDHKARTHQRIIDEASERFRRDGIGATGLQPLMKALGLTHGGFYAHFKSKDELVEEALRAASSNLNSAQNNTLSGDLRTLISGYLSTAHRDNPGKGCPLPTMSSELGQRGQPSSTTDELVRNRLANLEGKIGGAQAERDSIGTFCAMLGALMISRSVVDPELSERILDTTRDWLIEQTCDPRD